MLGEATGFEKSNVEVTVSVTTPPLSAVCHERTDDCEHRGQGQCALRCEREVL